MKEMTVKVVNRSGFPLPAYESFEAAGMDVRAAVETPVTLMPGKRMLVPTGLSIQLPPGYECQVRPRSGLALKKGITVLNTPGTIDADYRGEIGIILINLSDEPFIINPGERVAQLVVKEYRRIAWEEVERLDETKRGEGAFGHTGTD